MELLPEFSFSRVNHSCVACKSNSRMNLDYSFFRFPKDQERCSIWKKILKLEKLEILTSEQCYNRFRLCSKHFDSSMFSSKQNNRLKRTAVPNGLLPKNEVNFLSVTEIQDDSIEVAEPLEDSVVVAESQLSSSFANEESSDTVYSFEEDEVTQTPSKLSASTPRKLHLLGMDLSKVPAFQKQKRRPNPVYCTACPHNSNKNPSYSYFRFPRDDIRCNQWKDNLRLDKLSNITAKVFYTSRRICSAHFEDCMFSNALHSKLKLDAVPTINKQFQEESKETLNEKSKQTLNEKSKETLNEKSKETLNEKSNETLNEKSKIEAVNKEKKSLISISLKLPKLDTKNMKPAKLKSDLLHKTEIINKDKNSIKIVPETLDKVCRLCLKEVGTINIFDETSRKKDTKYFELISKLSLAQVHENDDLPTKICKSCATKMNDFCYFKEEVETAQVLLYIALGKIILQPLSRSSNFQNIDVISRKNVDVNSQSKNINVIKKVNYNNSMEECETITIIDDKDVNISESSDKETVNIQINEEIQTTENQNDKVDSQTNTVLTFKKDITGGSLLYNILANKDVEYNSTNNENHEENNIEEEEIYDKTDINSIMQCWKSYLYCVACNSNPNTHPEYSFFNFPVDDERSLVWRQVMKLDRLSYLSALECHKRYRLCSKHFEQTMFSSKDNSRLKRTAIPTNFSEKKKINKAKIETCSIGVQTESENDQEIKTEVNVNEESTDDLLCPETMEEIENTTTPIEIMDHSYTRSINKVKRSAFQCVSFNAEGKKIYTCVFCNEQFDIKSKYLSHKRREYLKRRPRKKIKITCTICGKLVVRERLKGHMITHTELRPHICEFCGKTFRSGANLSDHKAIHQEARYFCETCGKGFYVKRQLEAHVKMHAEGPCYICHICGFSSRSSQARSGHEKKHLLGKENFKQRNPYRGPPRQPPPKTKECNVCSKMFPSNAHLAIHMRSHTGEKPYKCIECDKNFLHIGGLNSHKMIHAGVKKYECMFCLKRFTLNGNLQQHMRTHTGEKPHECEFCAKKFYTNSALRKHKKIHERNMYTKFVFE